MSIRPLGDYVAPNSVDRPNPGLASSKPTSEGRTWEEILPEDEVPGNWSARKAVKSVRDAQCEPYKGWQIAAPAVQLARAKNFLADEDADRTPAWQQKFAELTEYFAYLQHRWDGEEWGDDLREAISMLRTHWLFESYHYGRPELLLEFPNPWPADSERLPQVTGSNLTAAGWHLPLSLDHGATWGRRRTIDPGVVFEPVSVKNVPDDKARDPWSYTLLNNRFKREDLEWAYEARPHAVKEAYAHKKRLKTQDPITRPPPNWKGPISPNLMDIGMEKTWGLLRRYRLLRESLVRSSRRLQRPFMDSVLSMLREGYQSRERLVPLHHGLSFQEYELDKENRNDLSLVCSLEEDWLDYLSEVSGASKAGSYELLEWRAQLLLDRTTELLNDLPHEHLFTLEKPATLNEFLTAVNEKIGGPVKKYRFTLEDLSEDLPKLVARNVLEMDGSRLWRPRPENMPEDMIIYGGPVDNRLSVMNRHGGQYDSQDPDSLHADTFSVDSDSTVVTIPPTVWTSETYVRSMPKLEIVEPWEHEKRATMREDNREQVLKFFGRLAYRFGLTLRVFEARYRQIQETLASPGRRTRNLSLLEADTAFWLDDTRKLPEKLPRNAVAGEKGGRVSMWYKDLVKRADPESFRPEWEKDDLRNEEPCRELVRTGILREAYENKTVLWPSDLRTRWSPCERTRTPTRGGLWSFGHPTSKAKAPQFWDINRWPVHLQSPQAQQEIRASGPTGEERTPRTKEHEAPNDDGSEAVMTDAGGSSQDGEPNDGESSDDNSTEDEGAIVTYAERYHNPKTVIRGNAEYWLGETPLQRKTFEDRFRARFETPKKRTWSERFTETVFGKKKEKDPLALPKIDERRIPKSRPAEQAPEGGRRKRRRLIEAILLAEHDPDEDYLSEGIDRGYVEEAGETEDEPDEDYLSQTSVGGIVEEAEEARNGPDEDRLSESIDRGDAEEAEEPDYSAELLPSEARDSRGDETGKKGPAWEEELRAEIAADRKAGGRKGLMWWTDDEEESDAAAPDPSGRRASHSRSEGSKSAGKPRPYFSRRALPSPLKLPLEIEQEADDEDTGSE